MTYDDNKMAQHPVLTAGQKVGINAAKTPIQLYPGMSASAENPK